MIKTSKEAYETQFKNKKILFDQHFSSIAPIEFFKSNYDSFRYRAEFSLSKFDNAYSYTMTLNGKKERIDFFPIASKRIQELMPRLLSYINDNSIVSDKLFQIEFQSSRNNEAMVSLVYHKELNENWYKSVSEAVTDLDVSIIGRSKKQQLIIGNNFITENYKYQDREFSIRLYEQCFSQTNPEICDDMLDWVTRYSPKIKEDIMELHCGLGTFTIPLSNLYTKVLATENSRPSIKALKENIELNCRNNIFFARLSGKETIEAYKKIRPYRRLSSINLDEFNIDTIFLDPPREGLDQFTRENIIDMENIIYVSCGFESFKRDLQDLQKTHEITNLAMFDQFPYTDHIESGAILKRKAPG